MLHPQPLHTALLKHTLRWLQVQLDSSSPPKDERYKSLTYAPFSEYITLIVLRAALLHLYKIIGTMP